MSKVGFMGKKPGHLEGNAKGPGKAIVGVKRPPLTERSSSMPPMTEDKSSRPPHVGGIKGGQRCTLCGGHGHSAKSHVTGDSGPSGPAIAQNKATQFGSSKAWASGGESDSRTTGSSNYKAPSRSEGGMS